MRVSLFGRMHRGPMLVVLLFMAVVVARSDARGELYGGTSAFEQFFVDLVNRWNGDFLWAPASMSNNTITRFGDEARAVFGQIPEGDCENDARTIPMQVEGNVVDLARSSLDSETFEFQYRDTQGTIVKRTRFLAQCDKPSLAGDVSYCGLNSRLKRVVKGNVEWLFLCRKSQPSLEVEASAYWSSYNPQFARYGVIGFNRQTGEIVYFDGTKEVQQFDWSRKFPPPGGNGYADAHTRARAEKLYDPQFRVPCSSCHDNKSPYAISPNISMSRVGYGVSKHNLQRDAFSLGEYLPRHPRSEDAPFRVIGTGYTATYKLELQRARTLRDPSGICTDCHTLTTQISGQRFASDALSREPYSSTTQWSTLLELEAERQKLKQIDLHRTDWAKSIEGGIHPWMPLGSTLNGATQREVPNLDQWRSLSDCLWGSGGDQCNYRPLYSACPPPEGREDRSMATDLKLETVGTVHLGGVSISRIRASWKYANDYGQVPGRDDVRFDVTVAETKRLSGEIDHSENRQTQREHVRSQLGFAGSERKWVVRNLSYFGHTAFSEPSQTAGPHDYALDIPAQCGRTYTIGIVAKRFCFDQSGTATSSRDHTASINVDCKAH